MPGQAPVAAGPVKVEQGESFADIPTKNESGPVKLQQGQRHDAFTKAGKSAAARSLVQPSRKIAAFNVPTGLPPVLDVTARLAAAAIETCQIDDARANECAAALDKAQRGFDVCMTHLLLERVCEHALIASRPRQRLCSSLNASLGRTGERLIATERDPSKDLLGIQRGDTAFCDLFLESVREKRGNGLAPARLTQLVQAVRDTKTADALKSAYDAIAKLFATPALSNGDRQKLLVAFLQTQGKLRANVISVTSATGVQGVMAFARAPIEKALTPSERAAIERHLKAAPAGQLEEMRDIVAALIVAPLFRAQDARPLVGAANERSMMLKLL